MSSSDGDSVTVRAIGDGDVEAVGRFLHEHLNQRISARDWVRGVAPSWSADSPNHGMMLVDEERIVGAFPAIYYHRQINGTSVAICNPHSWFVLESHRAKSMSLVLSLVKQPGYQFVMLTPNPSVTEIFRFLKFKPVNPGLILLPCLPWPLALLDRVTSASRADELEAFLGGESRRVYRDHRDLPWLHHLAVGDSKGQCHIVFKRHRIKALPVARVLHVSDADEFHRLWHHISNALLARFAMLGVFSEERWFRAVPWPAIRRVNAQPKLLSGKLIDESSIDDLYTELVALDI